MIGQFNSVLLTTCSLTLFTSFLGSSINVVFFSEKPPYQSYKNQVFSAFQKLSLIAALHNIYSKKFRKICNGVLVFKVLTCKWSATLIKSKPPWQVFSYEICRLLRNKLFLEHLWTTSPGFLNFEFSV